MKNLILILSALFLLTRCQDSHERAIELNDKAFVLMMTHKRDSVQMALPLLKEAMKLWPDYDIGCSNLGKCYWLLGHIDSTMLVNERFATITKKNQDRYSCYKGIATSYDIMGDKEKADAYYRKSLKYALLSLKSEKVGLPMYANIAELRKLLDQKDYLKEWNYAKTRFANAVDTLETNFYDEYLKSLDREVRTHSIREEFSAQLVR